MQYFVRRGSEEYGPYTLADLRRFAVTGNIAPTDGVRAEGVAESYPASTLLGMEAWAPAQGVAPSHPSPGSDQFGSQGPSSFASSTAVGPTAASIPVGAYLPAYQVPMMANGAALPPKLHWGLVLLLTIVTCGFFSAVWGLMQTWWVKQVDVGSTAFRRMLISIGMIYGYALAGNFLTPWMEHDNGSRPIVEGLMALFGLGMLICMLVSIVIYYMSLFDTRSSIERYFRDVEPLDVQINPAFLALGGIFYLQYHLTRIAQWKTTGQLPL